MQTVKSPKYTHDCAHCIFLGNYTHENQVYDLYFHESSIESTLIARFGSEGPDYMSGTCFSYSGKNPILTAARLKAQRLGLMQYSLESALYYATEGTYCFAELQQALAGSAYSELIQALLEQNLSLALNVWESLSDPEIELALKQWPRLLKVYQVNFHETLTDSTFLAFQQEMNKKYIK